MILDFDIELAKLAVKAGTGEIITRDGRNVLIVSWTNNYSEIYPISGVIIGANSVQEITSWSSGGQKCIGWESGEDLFIKPIVEI